MIYLVEFDRYDLTSNQVVRERFGTAGYVTLPTDTPANIAYDEYVIQPGNYQRNVFTNGTTSGESEVAFGFIELANADGSLDYLMSSPVDGRELQIYGLPMADSDWSERQLLFTGTMEQMEASYTKITIRIRDRLFELRENIQEIEYAGTTTAGGQNTAEGTEDDLKGKVKPLLFGAVKNVLPPLPNRFDRIYQISSRAFNAGMIVRDAGVPLTFTANYATIQNLRTASLTTGQFATAISLGLFRVGGTPLGDITVDASEGADGSRSAPRTVRRILEGFGLTTADFSAADLEALHASNPAEVGIWIGLETRDVLSVITPLLDTIGVTVTPDRNGVLRFFRIEDPSSKTPVAYFDRSLILDQGSGLQRLVTNDEGRGVPATKVVLRYGFNYTIQSGTGLAGATTEDFKAFAKEQLRTITAEDTNVKSQYLLASEPEFDTFFISLSDAQAEANRRLALYKVRRDRYRVPIKTEFTDGLDLGSIVNISVPRFGLDGGKNFLIIGVNEDYKSGVTTLDVYG